MSRETTANSRADDSRFFAERGFGGRVGFGVSPAVIVVDLVNAFTDAASPLGAEMGAEVDAARSLVEAARAAGVPRFFTTLWYEEPDLRDAGIWARKMKGLSVLRPGTPEVDIDARLERSADEPLVMKKYASSFFGTDLLSRLTSRGVDTLVIVGCTTSGCVRATAVDAIQFGFRPVVAREAVADRSAAAHAQALFDLEQKYADVDTVGDIVRELERKPSRHTAVHR
jgi:nicotinamidase-related amidase